MRPRELLTGFAPWIPLRNCWLGKLIPAAPGIYRIRRAGCSDLLYVGQTGKGSMTLRSRMGMLRGVFGPEMPYRDPHTAGPALWADLIGTPTELEVSVLPTPTLSTPERMSLEALVIAQHRQEFGVSPAYNFGRMPAGYAMSSANNASLVQRGLRRRGGPTEMRNQSHYAGVPPTGPLEGDPTGTHWLNLDWGDWTPFSTAVSAAVGKRGLYRLRRLGAGDLTYVGEGQIRQRLKSHLGKANQAGHRQGEFFSAPERLEASCIVADRHLDHHLLEVECDLIASHFLMMGRPPLAQFLG